VRDDDDDDDDCERGGRGKGGKGNAMKFNLDGLVVYFPYERIYLEQYQYMLALKRTLDASGHALLEMPTGTGKTVCLLSLITSYQHANPSCGKLVYCTRTVPEMNGVMEELGVVLAYRSERLASDRAAATAGGDGDEDDGIGATDLDASETNVDDVAVSPSSPDRRRRPEKRRKVYRGPPERRPGHRMGPSPDEGGAGGSGALALCLSSRRNMCVHEGVLAASDREGVDAACRSMTAPWAIESADKARRRRGGGAEAEAEAEGAPPSGSGSGSSETCSYYDGFREAGEATSMPSGVYDLDEIKKWGKSKNWCPYYLTRRAINHASVLVFNYQYMLDPKVAKMVSKELESESIIVFDEAHNIDSVCIEAFSVTIHSRNLERATRSLGRLSGEVNRVKATDGARLQNEYRNLVNGLIEQGLLDGGDGGGGGGNDAAVVRNGDGGSGLASNILSEDVVNEMVPGNIRRAEHFIAFMKKIVEHLKVRLRTISGPGGGVTSETPLAFLHRMVTTTSLEAKPLKFAYTRLSSLLRTLQVPNLNDYDALTNVADFASLIATYSEGLPRFAVIMEPDVGGGGGGIVPGGGGGDNPGIQLACLDSSLAIAPLFKRFGSVIITSGTLSPIDLYPKLLQFSPCISASFNMSTFRPCIRPLVITRGSDQLPVSTRFQDRGDMAVVRNYGGLNRCFLWTFPFSLDFICKTHQRYTRRAFPPHFPKPLSIHHKGTMMVELCGTIPDGVVAFFTSYSYMESIISEWDGMGIMRQLTKSKLVFIETKDVVETTMALDNFRRACDSGRGAVFLSVARGKVSLFSSFLQLNFRPILLIHGFYHSYRL
jgi:DNA excision repair protein ERCC-2